MGEQQHDLEQWPDILRRIAAIVGPELTLKLVAEHGGRTKTYIAPNGRRRHPWRSVITDDGQWAQIVAALGSTETPVHLPRGVYMTKLKKVEIVELAEQGVPVLEIMRRVGVTERYARRVVAAVRAGLPPVKKAPSPRDTRRAERELEKAAVKTKRKRRRRRRRETAEAARRRRERVVTEQLKLFG